MKHAQKKIAAKFLVVGGIGFVCNYAVLYACTKAFHIWAVAAEIIAAAIALQITFLLHDKWTYVVSHNMAYKHVLRRRYIVYIMTNSFGSFLTVVLFGVFSLFLSHLPALALAALIAVIWNFTMNKLLIWTHHKPLPQLSDSDD